MQVTIHMMIVRKVQNKKAVAVEEDTAQHMEGVLKKIQKTKIIIIIFSYAEVARKYLKEKEETQDGDRN